MQNSLSPTVAALTSLTVRHAQTALCLSFFVAVLLRFLSPLALCSASFCLFRACLVVLPPSLALARHPPLSKKRPGEKSACHGRLASARDGCKARASPNPDSTCRLVRHQYYGLLGAAVFCDLKGFACKGFFQQHCCRIYRDLWYHNLHCSLV